MRGGLAVLRTQIRYWRRHRLQALLCLLGIALGVAVYVAIQLATEGAVEAFAEGAEALAGRATHRVVDPARQGVPETLFATLRGLPGVCATAPFMRRRVRLQGRNLTVLGIDPFSDLAFRDVRYLAAQAGSPADGTRVGALLERFVGEPGAVAMPAALAAELGVALGQSFTAHSADGPALLHAVAFFELPPQRAVAFAATLLTDVSTFQETFDTLGRIEAIDLILAPDDGAAERSVQAVLPPPLRLEAAGRNTERVATMSRAFRLNLQALGLFALLVAVFLIFNAAMFSTVQRANQTAVLRCIGATRGRILRALLGEALLLGLVGGVLGVLLGRWLGGMMVRNTGATLFEVILNTDPVQADVALDAGTWAAGLTLSFGTALAGALWPAIAGARIPPVAALRVAIGRNGGARRWRWALAAGLASLGVALALVGWPGDSVVAALAGTSLVALSGALFCPLMLLLLGRTMALPLGWALGPAGRMAARNLPRAGMSTAALMVALALALAIEVTVRSFRSTFVLWLGQVVQAQLYLSPADAADDPQAHFTPQQVARLRALPFVKSLAELSSRRVLLGEREVLVIALHTEIFFEIQDLPLTGTDPAVARRQVEAGAVMVSEVLARALYLRPGDILALPTPGGMQRMPIAAVVRNYSEPSGIVYLPRERYLALYGNDPPWRIGLWVQPGIDLATAQAAIESGPDGAAVVVQPNALLREEALSVFDRTFAITDMLAALAAAVAFIAVVSALTSLLEERMRLLGYLRAIGMSARRVGCSMALEGVLMAFGAALMGWITGLVMSALLVYVVNPRAFGWSLQFHPAEGSYGRLLLLALGAALLGSWYPIRRATRLSVTATIREE
ncbi:MAG: ABC transporter permease [Candidatus Lambdaproteobacteria bacterium]|nr:ABC transporter permease [Candidatus Lambdaproteobacteria bacterium]